MIFAFAALLYMLQYFPIFLFEKRLIPVESLQNIKSELTIFPGLSLRGRTIARCITVTDMAIYSASFIPAIINR